jgi:hypothetical protein
MSRIINVYCDESCHLQRDGIEAMGFGAIVCPSLDVQRVSKTLYALRDKHKARGEIKWVKVSPSRLAFYEELIEYFFSDASLCFKSLIVQEKGVLDKDFFNAKGHHSFYYQMYNSLIQSLLHEANDCRVFIDIRDTWGATRVKLLSEYLSYESGKEDGSTVYPSVQTVHSDEVVLLQLADFLLGATMYANRPLPQPPSSAKLACVRKIESCLGLSLTESTPPWTLPFSSYKFSPTKRERKS